VIKSYLLRLVLLSVIWQSCFFHLQNLFSSIIKPQWLPSVQCLSLASFRNSHLPSIPRSTSVANVMACSARPFVRLCAATASARCVWMSTCAPRTLCVQARDSTTTHAPIWWRQEQWVSPPTPHPLLAFYFSSKVPFSSNLSIFFNILFPWIFEFHGFLLSLFLSNFKIFFKYYSIRNVCLFAVRKLLNYLSSM